MYTDIERRAAKLALTTLKANLDQEDTMEDGSYHASSINQAINSAISDIDTVNEDDVNNVSGA